MAICCRNQRELVLENNVRRISSTYLYGQLAHLFDSQLIPGENERVALDFGEEMFHFWKEFGHAESRPISQVRPRGSAAD
jgi:hypothetical protein